MKNRPLAAGQPSLRRRPGAAASPLRLVFIVMGSVFVSESVLMMLLLFLPPLSQVLVALVDASLLTVLVSPMLYLFLLRPMKRQIAKRERTERALLRAHKSLEARVQERTTDLAQANRLLHAIIDTMPAGVIVANSDGAIVLTNGVARNIMGSAVTGSAIQPRGYSLYRMDGSPFDTAESPLVSAIWRGETIHGIEALVRRENGAEAAILIAAAPVRDEAGDIISGVALFQDITDYKRIEQALQASEETARVLMNASPESAMLIDSDGVVAAANEPAAVGLQTTPARVVGANLYGLFPQPVAEMQRARVEEVIRTGRPLRFEEDRFDRQFDNYIHPLHDVEGKVVLLAVFGRDVTEHKRAERQAQQLAVLEERQRLARELHDSLSQALFGISLGCHTALTWLDRNRDKVVEALGYALSLADAGLTEMRALIFELRPESLVLEGLVSALTKQADAVRARNGIDVKTDLCTEFDAPLETQEALYRIAQESLHNIVKHAQANHVTVKLAGDEESVQLEVSDDGVGFDPARLHAGHLGLLSMRERAERLGGTFEIESAFARGTRIRARFPVTRTSRLAAD